MIHPFEVYLSCIRIRPQHFDFDLVTQTDDGSRISAEKLLGLLIVLKPVSAKGFKSNEPVNIVRSQLHKNAELSQARDHAFHFLTHMPLHKPAFFHGDQFAFGLHGSLFAGGLKSSNGRHA